MISKYLLSSAKHSIAYGRTVILASMGRMMSGHVGVLVAVD